MTRAKISRCTGLERMGKKSFRRVHDVHMVLLWTMTVISEGIKNRKNACSKWRRVYQYPIFLFKIRTIADCSICKYKARTSCGN